jgi:hypothetical protein
MCCGGRSPRRGVTIGAVPLTDLQNRQRKLEETQAALEAQQRELETAQKQFLEDREEFAKWANHVRHVLSRFLAGLVVVAVLVTVALAIGGYLLSRQSEQRHDAITSSCQARNQTSKGILRFLHERAPNAPLTDRHGNAYFPVVPDCSKYADDLS